MPLIKWAGVFAVLALLSAALGFTGISSTFDAVFQLGFYVLLALAALFAIVGGVVRRTME